MHLPSECSTCLTNAECQGKCLPDNACHGICLPDEECQGIYLPDVARVLQIQSVKADVVRMRGVRAFASERSAYLTDTECQGKFLPDAKCEGKCRTDNVRPSICLPDEDCQGNSLLDTEWQGKCHPDNTCHGVCLLEECLHHPDAAHLTVTECQGKWDPDKAYNGAPHIGNRVVTVVASKRNYQGIVHCSEDFELAFGSRHCNSSQFYSFHRIYIYIPPHRREYSSMSP